MRRTVTMREAAMAAVVVVGLALTTGGCGGGKPPTKEEYLARAKDVCTKGNAELKKSSDELTAKIPQGQKISDEQVAAFVKNTVVPMIRKEVHDLRKITPPKGEKAHLKEIYDALDKGLDDLAADPKKLTTTNVFAHADELGKQYGISVCAAAG